MSYIYIFGTIFFTVYGQLIIKWQMAKIGVLPSSFNEKMVIILLMFLNPWILSALISAFLAAICWMVAMTKYDLSYAYPFMSLSFVMVLVLSGLFFQESITPLKIIGASFIIIGITIGAQG